MSRVSLTTHVPYWITTREVLLALLGNLLVAIERFLSYPIRYALEPTLLVSRLTPLSVLRHLIFFYFTSVLTIRVYITT